ncbi:GOLPH3/VPS74 family protein [Embleya sp. MST-111070]|uniref:GOLPH3/VPS74 family protein n=1 Tax=Embleya sp. MST-111070 TaxID=3398231 RepID=UPI003F73D157
MTTASRAISRATAQADRTTIPKTIRRPGAEEVDVHATLPQRVFLLAYSPERQLMLSRTHLGATLQAAALYELHDLGLIHDDAGRVRATPGRTARARAAVPPCELAADLLARIEASERAYRWRHWVKKRDRHAVDLVADALVRQRVIRYETRRLFGLIPYRRFVLRQAPMRVAAINAMRAALRGRVAEVPTPDAALAVLAYHGELRTVLGGRERREAKDRIRALSADLGPVPDALREAVRNTKAELSAAG